MPRCSVCHKWSLLGFAKGAAKPTHIACLRREMEKRYTGTKYANATPVFEKEDSDPIVSPAGLLLLNSLLSDRNDNHDESTPEPFEGKGGEFGGAGATGSWPAPDDQGGYKTEVEMPGDSSPAEERSTPSEESSMSIPSEDHTSEDISESSSGSSEPSSESDEPSSESSSDSGGGGSD